MTQRLHPAAHIRRYVNSDLSVGRIISRKIRLWCWKKGVVHERSDDAKCWFVGMHVLHIPRTDLYIECPLLAGSQTRSAQTSLDIIPRLPSNIILTFDGCWLRVNTLFSIRLGILRRHPQNRDVYIQMGKVPHQPSALSWDSDQVQKLSNLRNTFRKIRVP